MTENTIAAVASPAGAGAVALLRVSGPAAGDVARAVFRGGAGDEFPARTAVFGRIVDADGGPIDQVLLTWFPGPASFTGEDTVEISCHGGVLVTRRILERLLQAGAVSAGPGEFTRRAFLNGKLDLTRAEAVMDVISAQTDLALRSAQRQLDGSLGRAIAKLRDDALAVVAHVEAHIDFPEEDIDPETGAALRRRMEAVHAEVRRLLATAEEGSILREGLRTVIAGAPNAGKSSLLNLLLGFERAIVSERPGTTRDTIEETISLRGFPLRLVDTAGLRAEPEDAVEQEGIARTRRQVESADLVLEVVDGSLPPGAGVPLSGNLRHHVRVLNKADLGIDAGWAEGDGVRISCRTGDGREALADRIAEAVAAGGDAIGSADIAVSARHRECLERAEASMVAALAEFDRQSAPEFVALDLRAALEALGDIAGRIDTDDLLGEIFSRFCIGK